MISPDIFNKIVDARDRCLHADDALKQAQRTVTEASGRLNTAKEQAAQAHLELDNLCLRLKRVDEALA
jgi:hypothetical protein